MEIKKYKSFLESKSGKLYRYGCVVVYLDIPNWDSIVSHIDSEDLYKELSKLPHTTDYPDYQPHITIAYLQPGKGQKYIETDYKYNFNQVKKIIYSKANDQKLEITLD